MTVEIRNTPGTRETLTEREYDCSFGINNGGTGIARGTFGVAWVLIKCGSAQRVAPSGDEQARMSEDNEHDL